MIEESGESGANHSNEHPLGAIAVDFERALDRDRSARIEDYLPRVEARFRSEALVRLIKIEIAIRGNRHERVGSSRDYLDRFPGCEAAVAKAFEHSEGWVTVAQPIELSFDSSEDPRHQSASKGARTIEHSSRRRDSRGLHIRCPHCSNPVELLADTPYEEISCNSCGSMFSLVDRNESTRMTAPLKTIARFDLISRLGLGGFGTVWKARDRELDRVVAIKIPRRGQLSPTEIEQFFREARAAAQLRHPNIAAVHEVGREEDTVFIVSDLIRGVTLADWLTANRPSPDEVAQLCIPVTDALNHAHQHGIIHRDLKPSNIMIGDDGRPILMDFGLAKREVGEITMTVDGQILGTPRYMSPEQAGGEAHWTDRRTDIYSLGIIMFEMITGEGPFRGNAQMQVQQRLTEDAPNPRKLNRHIPRDMSTICLKCLEREPGRRYSTANELKEELERFLRGEPISARPISPLARLGRWAKRKPALAATAALILFLAVAGPIVAILIEGQRIRLEELVTEKNHLIDRDATQKRNADRQIADLNKQLSLWTGKSNPWEFWPPKVEEPPRQQVLAGFFNHSREKLLGQLKAGTYGDETKARGYFGLAIIADALGRKSEAKSYYEAARAILEQLRVKSPGESRFVRGIAECDFQMARLAAGDHDLAKTNLEKARDVYQQLAEDHGNDVKQRVAWLEAELYSATLVGFDLAKDHLNHVAEINTSLQSIWPTDPDKAYRLACYLVGKDPFLITETKEPID